MNAINHTPEFTRHAAWRIWENPIFLRYCRSRLRLRGLGIALLITLLIAAFISGLVQSIGARSNTDPVSAARSAIIPLFVFQALILFVLGTAQTSGGMITERDEGVIDYQRLIPMTPLSKVLGYLFGLPVREYVMFLCTLPFTAWAIWSGGIECRVWLPLYLILLSTTLTYHFTGLVTGTVVRNRRWAFLISIGLVFSLYTIVPQMANFGLVFFKYLTITPVFEESLPGLLPKNAATALKAGQQLFPTVKFFDLDFPEAVFTAFSQGGLILVFATMLCRKWQRHEARLLNKAWALGFYAWVQVLLLGNALPLIETGELFPSRGFERFIPLKADWAPTHGEALVMITVYGIFSLSLTFILALIITPNIDRQTRGWRKARKHGQEKIPMLGDAASATGFVAIMSMLAAFGWHVFTWELVESRWYPGHRVGIEMLGIYAIVMLVVGLGFQTLLQWKGGRSLGLVMIFIGVVPIMAGSIMGTISNDLLHNSSWITSLSPLSLPIYAPISKLSINDVEKLPLRSITGAFQFWLVVWSSVTVWLTFKAREGNRELKARVFAEGDGEAKN
ncbi:MAG: hypothetical protein RLZ22_424 [Verrucomicrobiota bacterium]|jgi:hypothetical protein